MNKLLLVLLAACGSDVDSGIDGTLGSFDDELPDFADTICSYETMCGGETDKAACIRDVMTDMADAKSQLDDAGDAACANCMNVKSVEISKILDASCDASAADTQAILAACGADDANCAGYP